MGKEYGLRAMELNQLRAHHWASKRRGCIAVQHAIEREFDRRCAEIPSNYLILVA